MAFDVGDRVVYPHHGAAIIVRKETRDFNGEDTEYLVLEVTREEARVTISAPSEKVDDVGMRPPISRDEVEDLFDLLAKRDIREPANWSRRFKNHQEKLKSGEPSLKRATANGSSMRPRTASRSPRGPPG